MTKKRRKNIEERYLNNSGTPIAVVIPAGFYYSVELPKGVDPMDVKAYNYQNNRYFILNVRLRVWISLKVLLLCLMA